MYDPQEVFQTILDLRISIRSYIKKFRFYGRFENEDDVIGQIMVDISEFIINHKRIERATLKTFVQIIIHYWFLKQLDVKKKVIHFQQLPLIRDEDGNEFELDVACEGTPIDELIGKEEMDALCYAIHHLPPEKKLYVDEMLKGGTCSERSRRFQVSKQLQFDREKYAIKYMKKFCETNTAPYGFSDIHPIEPVKPEDEHEPSPAVQRP